MRWRRKPIPRMVCGVCALWVATELWAVAQPRIVAIGDVHGSYPQFVRLLQQTGLIDAQGQWIGEQAILIQLGDVPDRGTRTRDCLDLLMHLEDRAAKRHGRVYPLLGNHEVMVIMGDLRYVGPEDYRSFVTERSEQVRDEAYKDYEEYWSSRKQRHISGGNRPASRKKWRTDHPLGFFEFREAFGPHGQYGRWVRKLDTVAQVDDVLFLHGGLSPRLQFTSIEKLNEHLRSELTRFDSIWQLLVEKKIIWRYMTLQEATGAVREELPALQSLDRPRDTAAAQAMRELLNLDRWLTVSSDGPLWYRGYAWEPEKNLAPVLEEMMARLKVRRMVLAHTITDSRQILPRFDKRVFLIDTGMMLEPLRQGRASALEILDGRFVATYADGKEQVLLSPADGGTVPAPSGSGSGERQQE